LLKDNLTRGLLAGALLALVFSCPVQTARGQEGVGRGVAAGVGTGRSPAEVALADRLLSAADEREQQRLLEEHRQSVTPNLVDELLDREAELEEQSRYPEMFRLYELAHKVAARIGYKRGAARALKGLGQQHFTRGEYAKALEHAARMRALYEELGDRWGIAAAHTAVALVSHTRGDYDAAMKDYGAALTILRELGGNDAGVAYLLNNMGDVYRLRGDNKRALELFGESLKMEERMGRKLKVAGVLNNMGIAHRNSGQIKEALEVYERSLAISGELNNKRDMGGTLNNIGVIHSQQGRHEEALSHYQKSLVYFEEIGFKRGVAITLTSIGHSYKELGKREQAAEYYRRAVKLQEELGNKQAVKDLQSLLKSLKR
jgi:tetratricopeptide (TPR) repeat protein